MSRKCPHPEPPCRDCCACESAMAEALLSPAAGPWRKWPEERPQDAGRLYLVAWQIAQPSVMVWGGEGSWEGYSITHWAEILPPREER